jgi:hypothetical protein
MKEFKVRRGLEYHMNRKNPCLKAITETKNIINIDNSNILDEVYHDNVNIEKKLFDIGKIFKGGQDNISMIIAGARGSGKTTLINYLYPMFIENFDIVLFFSFSLHNKLYSQIQEPKFDEFSPQVIYDLFYFQKKTNNMFNVCVIFDDMISGQLKNDDAILQMFVRGRNSNISVVLTTQALNMMKNVNRMNSSYLFIGKNNSPGTRETIIEEFLLNSVPVDKTIKTKSKKISYIDKWLVESTKDYNFVVIDYYDTDNPEQIYNFKTPLN